MKQSFKRHAVVAALIVGLVGVLAPSAAATHSNLVLQCPEGEFRVDAQQTGTWFEAPPNSQQILKGEDGRVFVLAQIVRNGQLVQQRNLGSQSLPLQSHSGLVERSNVELVTCRLVTAAGNVFEFTGIMTPGR